MALSDWDISGDGGQAIVDDGGSMRCQLTGSKLMLWNGQDSLVNTQITAEIKNVAAGGQLSGLVLRCDDTSDNCYFDRITVVSSKKYHYVYRIVSGVATLIAQSASTESYSVYTKTRFSINGSQVSVEEWLAGDWSVLISVTDSVLETPGYAGLKSQNTAGYSTLFDNIIIAEVG